MEKLNELQSLLNLLQRMGVTRYRTAELEVELAIVQEPQVAPQPGFPDVKYGPGGEPSDLYTELLGGRTRWPGGKE